MSRPPARSMRTTPLPLLAALLAAGCSSAPSQLYLLSAVPATPANRAQADAAPAGYGSSRPAGGSRRSATPTIGVAVTIPEYLDRTDVMERTSANELKPVYSAQWAESLAVASTRAVSENLMTLLPSDDIIALPSRSRRAFDYQVNLDLTRFESDPKGVSTLAGRWSISDGEGTEYASGRVFRSEQAGADGYGAMAAAMSRNLAAVSGEVAAALQRLPAKPGAQGAPAPSRSSAQRARR